jgi:hypothetical protein
MNTHNGQKDTTTDFVGYLRALTLEVGAWYRDAKPGHWCQDYGQRPYAVGHLGSLAIF